MIRYIVLFAALMLLNESVYPQAWPILKKHDSKDWQSISCTFGEIHKTGKDHIHCGVDIDINSSRCPVHAIQDGRFHSNGNTSITLEHEYPKGSGKYNRRSRYLHVYGKDLKNKSIKKGQQITKVRNNRGGYGGHLHLELWQFDNGKWYCLNPFRNDAEWNVTIPKDSYDPEINQVFLCPVGNSEIPSGYTILSNRGGLYKGQKNSVKIHLKDRPGASGKTYNAKRDKVVVYGNIGPVVFARDKGINCLEASGEGMTVYTMKYSINGELKYELTFDRVEKEAIYDVDNFFERSFNRRRNDKFNGNYDYLKLFNTSDNYYYPQKLVSKKKSNGIWQTAAAKSFAKISHKMASEIANLSEDALYPDGEYTLSFYTEDAAVRKDSAEIKVIVDNFYPYIKEVVVYSKEVRRDKIIYSGKWDYNPKTSLLTFKNSGKKNQQASKNNLNVTVKASEPMNNLSISIPLDKKSKTIKGSPAKNSDNCEWVFIIPAKLLKNYKKSGKLDFSISGEDLAGNKIFGFESTEQFAASSLPKRNNDGGWDNLPETFLDKIHGISLK